MSRIRADQYEQGELASRRAGTRIREIRGFSFSSQSRVVRGSTSSFSRPSIFFSAEKETKLKKPEKSSIFVKIFRFSTMARVVVAQRPVAVLCSIPECRDSSPSLRGRRSLRRREHIAGQNLCYLWGMSRHLQASARSVFVSVSLTTCQSLISDD